MVDVIKKAVAKKKEARARGPVWKGPEVDGITSSLLSRYLSCKERFRILVIEGLKPKETFNSRIEYGNMWHAAEEAAAKESAKTLGEKWLSALTVYCKGLAQKFRGQQEEINDWYSKTKALFPIYIEHWKKHPDVQKRKPLLSEQVFNVAYQLPSGRIIRLRGKWDSVDLVETVIWLQENKTKSQIDRIKIERQLRFDLQTMLYLTALRQDYEVLHKLAKEDAPIAGVRYNVIRRSSHKSLESMLKKIQDDFSDGRGREWFDRWNVEISHADIQRFRKQCLDPVLENLCDDYEWWSACSAKMNIIMGADHWDMERRIKAFPNHRSRHYRQPYMGYNPLDDGGFGDIDGYMENGSEVGLERTTNLFPELTNG